MSEERIRELVGFIDGIEARNQESIRKRIAVQIEEMRTRLKLILVSQERRESQENASDIVSDVKDILDVLNDGNVEVVKRTATAGERLCAAMIKHRDVLATDDSIRRHFKGVTISYIDAAERSRAEQLIVLAKSLGRSYKEVTAAGIVSSSA
jgi:hypothetical protein